MKQDSSFFNYDKFKTDNIRAVDAKFEAQKIAFAPMCYQAIRTMLELGMMQAINDAGDAGITCKELAEKVYNSGLCLEEYYGLTSEYSN